MKNICTLFVCLFVCLLPTNAMKGKRNLDLSNQGLVNLSEVVFDEAIKNIDLNSNQLTTLDGANFPEGLATLDISNNQINELSNLPNNLIALTTNDNQLLNLTGLNNNLELLFADNNQLTSLDAVTIAPNLDFIHVNNNQITDISVIQNLNNLEQFSFENNPVTDINFTWPASLETVSFSDTLVEDISPLAQATNLEAITSISTIAAPSITAIPDFSNLNNLQRLNISGHAVVELNCNNLPGSLRTIFLLKNQTSNIVSPCELNMPRLKNLNLGSNNITEINMTLNRAKKLKEIDLSSNDLTSLVNLTIKPRRKNFTLDVRDNGNLPQSEIKAFKKRHPNARVKSGGFF